MTIQIAPVRACFVGIALLLAVGCRAHWDGECETLLLIKSNQTAGSWEIHISSDEGTSYSLSTSGIDTQPVVQIPCSVSGRTGSDEVTVYLGNYQIVLIQDNKISTVNRVSADGKLIDFAGDSVVLCALLDEDLVHDNGPSTPESD